MTDTLGAIKARRAARQSWVEEEEDGSVRCRHCRVDPTESGWAHTWDCPANEQHLYDDFDTLIGEAERLRDLVDAYDDELYKPDEVDEIKRLRGLLGRLEWAHDAYEGSGGGACPVCYGGGVHAPDCWLAKELHPNEDEASPPKG